jgi:hypothetical protein
LEHLNTISRSGRLCANAINDGVVEKPMLCAWELWPSRNGPSNGCPIDPKHVSASGTVCLPTDDGGGDALGPKTEV